MSEKAFRGSEDGGTRLRSGGLLLGETLADRLQLNP